MNFKLHFINALGGKKETNTNNSLKKIVHLNYLTQIPPHNAGNHNFHRVKASYFYVCYMSLISAKNTHRHIIVNC